MSGSSRKILKFICWCISSLFLFVGCNLCLFNPNKFIGIIYIALSLIFLPPLYSQLTNRYGLKRNIVGRIIIFFLLSVSTPAPQQASKTQTTSTQVVVQTPKAETPKPIFVSPEYKMFRSAGASPKKAQALKDACTADKTCPTTLKIAKAVVRGEITLGLVSKPEQPCTEAEFKKDENSLDDGDFCYSKSAEGRKSIREAEAASKAQENKPSAVESWKEAAVLAESQPNSKDLADKAEKARLEAIVENGKSHGLSKAYGRC